MQLSEIELKIIKQAKKETQKIAVDKVFAFEEARQLIDFSSKDYLSLPIGRYNLNARTKIAERALGIFNLPNEIYQKLLPFLDDAIKTGRTRQQYSLAVGRQLSLLKETYMN